jgi:cytochrome P450
MPTKATKSTPVTTRLRQFKDLPGPRPWPFVGNALQVTLSRLHQDVEGWAKQYGPVFQMHLGPTKVLVIADHKVETALLKDRPDGFRRPKQLVDTLEEMGLQSGLLTAEGQAWKDQRRMVMASLSAANVRSYFPSLLKVTKRLQGRWLNAADTGATIDLQADFMRYTVDAIAGLSFGSDINTLETDDDVIQHHLDKILPALFKRVNAIVPYWRIIKLPSDRQLDRSVALVNESINGFITKARKRLNADTSRQEQPQNLLESMIIAADKSDSGVNNKDVAGNVVTMLLAGEETTATTLSWLIYLLKRNPNTLQCAQAEVRKLIGDTDGNIDNLTPDKLGDLKFIEACILETLRLKPTGPFNVLVALEDTEVAGIAVPKDMWIWSVCRHDTLVEHYFPDPNAFKPQRWLKTEDNDLAQSRRVSMPFGSGPRICPGRYLAILEIKLAMVMLLKNFDIESVDTPDGGEAQEMMSITMNPVGLTMKLNNRFKSLKK